MCRVIVYCDAADLQARAVTFLVVRPESGCVQKEAGVMVPQQRVEKLKGAKMNSYLSPHCMF